MSLNDCSIQADALLDTPLRPDRVHCRLRKEPGVRLEVRHRRLLGSELLLGSEFVVLADVAAGEVVAELVIPRLLVAEVARSLEEVDQYLGAEPVPIHGQLRLF